MNRFIQTDFAADAGPAQPPVGRNGDRLRWGVQAAIGVFCAGIVVFEQTPLVLALRALSVVGTPCKTALAHLRSSTREDDAILTSNPWFVSWEAERPGVNAPTNGTRALITVARHYRTRWALTGVPVLGALELESALATPEVREALRPVRVLEDGPCALVRLSAVPE